MRGQNGWGQGGCCYVTLFSTPTCMNKRTLCPRVTDGSVLATACGKLPILSSITLCTEDSWEADIPSSQFSVENKRVWDPSYTHVHVCMWPTPNHHHHHHRKIVNSSADWSYFSKAGLQTAEITPKCNFRVSLTLTGRIGRKDFDTLSHQSTANFTCQFSYSIYASSPYWSSAKLWSSNWKWSHGTKCITSQHMLCWVTWYAICYQCATISPQVDSVTPCL